MFFEPGQFPDMMGSIGGVDLIFHLGFETPPGGQIGSPNHVLNDHTYCCQMGLDVCSATGEPASDMKAKCLEWHEKRIGTRSQDAEKLGIPLFISEFGACLDSDACATEVTQVADVCDENLAGWSYWEFKPFHDLTTSAGNRSEGFYNNDGSLQTVKVKALTRPYVKAAQGTINSMKFVSEGDHAGSFTADITVEVAIQEPTLIHILTDTKDTGVSWYPNGIEYTVTSTGAVQPNATINQVGNTLEVQVNNQDFDGQVLTITITPK
jgi:hypothetical protein